MLGGVFNPVHQGHLAAALAARRVVALDEVWMVLTRHPPHKSKALTSIRHRLAMLRLAVGRIPGVKISLVEVKRPGVHYAIDTVKRLAKRYPAVVWTYILGADAALHFRTWREWRAFPRYCRIAIVARPGVERRQVKRVMGWCGFRVGREYDWVGVRTPDVSSTSIRLRRMEKAGIAGRVAPAVAAYIRRHHLYET